MAAGFGTFLTILVLCGVHVASGMERVQRRRWTPRLLSMAAGISVSYVFLDLMPALAQKQAVIERAGLLPQLDHHVYLFALIGLVVAFWVETASRASRRRHREAGAPDRTGAATYRLSIASFVVLNAAIGYATGSPGDEAVEPLWLFALALALHFLVNDHSLVEHHGPRYQRFGRWWLVLGLLAGWLIGIDSRLEIPEVALALALSYVSGGTILNILRHELPDTDRTTDVGAFLLGTLLYGTLLLLLR